MIVNSIKNSLRGVFQLVFPLIYRRRIYQNFHITFQNRLVDQEFSILPYLLNTTSYVLDIGANNGEYCYFFQEIIKTNNIVAFEPIPRLHKRLKILFPSIEVLPFAISNIIGKATLHIPYIKHQKFETRAKLDLLKEQDETRLETIEVQTKTIDEIYYSRTKKIDFIKIDIEGHELKAIRGAKKLIEKDLPILFVEIEKRHHLNDFNDVIQEICALRYSCFFLEEKILKGFSEFSIDKHQNLDRKENYYIHNFFFFPESFSVEELNKKIKK